MFKPRAFFSLWIWMWRLWEDSFSLKRPSYVAGLGWKCLHLVPAGYGSVLGNPDTTSCFWAHWSLLLWSLVIGLDIEMINQNLGLKVLDGWRSSGLLVGPRNLHFCRDCIFSCKIDLQELSGKKSSHCQYKKKSYLAGYFPDSLCVCVFCL